MTEFSKPPSRPPVPTFTLAISMDAKAFGATHGTRMIELGKVLSDMTYAIERGKLHPGGTMTLKDGDGVTVGWATLGHDKS